jgi:hypothetical protein
VAIRGLCRSQPNFCAPAQQFTPSANNSDSPCLARKSNRSRPNHFRKSTLEQTARIPAHLPHASFSAHRTNKSHHFEATNVFADPCSPVSICGDQWSLPVAVEFLRTRASVDTQRQ